MQTVEVTLPVGLAVDGQRQHTAQLRSLNGYDEAFLQEEGRRLLPAHRTTVLLSRCVTRLGTLAPVPPDTVRSLTIGDREALLLHLRRLAFGERLQCVLSCPASDCGEKMDLDLHVSDLLVPACETVQERHEAVFTAGGVCYRVRYRLPNGADQEAAAEHAQADLPGAARLILERCIQQVWAEDEPLAEIPAAVAVHLPPILAERDPQAELLLNLTCPVCNTAFVSPLDTADYLFRELDAHRSDLWREVHLLAFHYHWSEAEILGLPGPKRRLYLDLIAETLRTQANRK